MDETAWPSQRLRPMLRVRLAEAYVGLVSLCRHASVESAPETVAGFDRVADAVIEQPVGNRPERPDPADRLDAISEFLFSLQRDLTLTDAESAAVAWFSDAIGRTAATGRLDPVVALTGSRRTEWAVACLSHARSVSEGYDDVASVPEHVLDATLSALFAWLQREKTSPPGEMTDAERDRLETVLREANAAASADGPSVDPVADLGIGRSDDSRSVTADESSGKRRERTDTTRDDGVSDRRTDERPPDERAAEYVRDRRAAERRRERRRDGREGETAERRGDGEQTSDRRRDSERAGRKLTESRSRERSTDEWPAPDDYAEMVDPLAVREVAVEIASEEDHSGPDHANVRQLARLYDHVRDEIDYVADPRRNYVAPPAETLRVGGGDCDCQAVLAASLFEAIGAGTYLAEVASADGGLHLLPLVDCGPPEQRDWITDRLAEAYDDRPTDGFAWVTGEDAVWVLADPVIGRYLGDRQRLTNAGFIHEQDDGWEWHEDRAWYRTEPS